MEWMEEKIKRKKGKRETQALVWRGSSKLASCMSVFLGTGGIMCLTACTCVILFAQQSLSTVTTGGPIERSTRGKEEKDVCGYSIREVIH